jgi:hypothetical protein
MAFSVLRLRWIAVKSVDPMHALVRNVGVKLGEPCIDHRGKIGVHTCRVNRHAFLYRLQQATADAPTTQRISIRDVVALERVRGRVIAARSEQQTQDRGTHAIIFEESAASRDTNAITHCRPFVSGATVAIRWLHERVSMA